MTTDELPDEQPAKAIREELTKPRERGGAAFVAAGILLSRIFGFIREALFAHYFGNSWVADAFKGALRIPNFLQNLFGEGVLSASFIPVFVGLRTQGEEEGARDLARAVGTILSVVALIISLAGVCFAPLLVDVVTPGFSGETRELAVLLVRIFFPGAALLVLSAWCLGILNSHRRFFLPYASPVLWNGAIIFALLFFGQRYDGSTLAIYVAWGVTVGSLLQLLVQLPTALRLIGRFAPRLGLHTAHLRNVLKNFVPVVLGRGVVQVSAFIDSMIASFLPQGGLATLIYAQTLYLLPVSLFGMSISAAELPTLSGISAQSGDNRSALRDRLSLGLSRIAFFIIPSVVFFIVLGDLAVGGLYQSGRFTRADTEIVWATLAALSVGLFASTQSRLYSSTYYSLQDTRTPLRCAVKRVALSVALGLFFGLYLPRALSLEDWGVVGLAFATGSAAWLEYALLKTELARRIGAHQGQGELLGKLWIIAIASAVLVCGARWLLPAMRPVLSAAMLIPLYGVLYLGTTAIVGVPFSRELVRRFSATRTKEE